MNPYPVRQTPVAWHFRRWFAIIVSLLLVGLSCTLVGTEDTSLIQTQTALQVQLTVQSQQQNQNFQETAMAAERTQIAQEIQATTLAAQMAQLTQQSSNNSSAPSTQEPPPPPPPASSPAPSVDIQSKIKSAKILLFEDMAGTGNLEYYQEALEMGGFTFKDDGSAQGWFKEDLLGGKWDLIIAASESRTKIQGEFFQYLLEHINRGTAVIIEHWALDDLSQGKVAPILSKCGVAVQRDWFFQDLAFADLSVWPLVSGHPIFNEPNTGISLRNFTVFWKDNDQGDFLKLTGSGDAQMIAGNIATSKSDHGTIATCLGGRLIIQTFSSHNYRRDDVTRLIENYVHYTLTNYFLANP